MLIFEPQCRITLVSCCEQVKRFNMMFKLNIWPHLTFRSVSNDYLTTCMTYGMTAQQSKQDHVSSHITLYDEKLEAYCILTFKEKKK